MSNLAGDRATTAAPVRAFRGALGALVPDQVRRFIRRCVDLDARSRRVLMRQALRRFARGPRAAESVHGAPLHNIVFVCHGNILRSAFAAALLRRELDEKHAEVIVGSAGLHAKSGRLADQRGILAAQAFGIDLCLHRAAPLTREMVRDADLLAVMDFENEAECIARFPEAEGKLRLLGIFDTNGSRDSVEIVDPYTQDFTAVTRCYEDVARCTRGLRSILDDVRSARR